VTIELLRGLQGLASASYVQANEVSPRVVPCDDRDSGRGGSWRESASHWPGSVVSLADKEELWDVEAAVDSPDSSLGGLRSRSC
jgi:hypothetical protein